MQHVETGDRRGFFPDINQNVPATSWRYSGVNEKEVASKSSYALQNVARTRLLLVTTTLSAATGMMAQIEMKALLKGC